MSQTIHDAGADINQARKDALVWLKAKIKSDLRTEADELLNDAEDQKSGKTAKGKAFEFTRFGLEQQVEAKRKANKYIMVGALNVTCWCPMPRNLWAEFSQDGVFLTELHDRLARLIDRLVDSCAKSCSAHELEIARKEVEHPENLEQYVKEGNDSFIGYCDTLQQEIEKEATEIIAGSFKERVKTLEKYKTYQFKAGAKLGFTVAALAASIAVLATAATPAAPATLVPALYGIITTSANILIQIGQMSDEAEEVEQDIRANFENIEAHYKDKDGKERKLTFKAREFATGFGAVVTGGVSDLVWPSIKLVISETKRHSSKLDGLESSLHGMSQSVSNYVEISGHLEKAVEHFAEELDKHPTPKAEAIAKKFKETREKDLAKFEEKLRDLLGTSDGADGIMAGVYKRIQIGRAQNAELMSKLLEVQKALGTKNFALAGEILGSAALFGSTFCGGVPKPDAVKEWATVSVAIGTTVCDSLREYTTDVVKGFTH